MCSCFILKLNIKNKTRTKQANEKPPKIPNEQHHVGLLGPPEQDAAAQVARWPGGQSAALLSLSLEATGPGPRRGYGGSLGGLSPGLRDGHALAVSPPSASQDSVLLSLPVLEESPP